MKENRLVSIIIPIFNAERYLEKCVASVLSQTYQDFEVILVDDGSTDGSPGLCDGFCEIDSRFTAIHKKNGGVSSARNLGIDQSRGAYIMFLDADDEIVPECVEILMNNLAEHSADVSCGRTLQDSYDWFTNQDVMIWSGDEPLKQSLMDNPLTYAAWGKIYTREIIGDTRFNSTVRINEDSLFVFEICCKRPVFVSTEKRVYIYNNVPNSASRQGFSEKYLDILAIAKRKEEIIRREYPQFRDLVKNVCVKAKMNYLHLLCSRTGNEHRSMELRLIREIKENKKYYIPAAKADDRWMFIIEHHLYFVYKWLLRLKRLIKQT